MEEPCEDPLMFPPENGNIEGGGGGAEEVCWPPVNWKTELDEVEVPIWPNTGPCCGFVKSNFGVIENWGKLNPGLDIKFPPPSLLPPGVDWKIPFWDNALLPSGAPILLKIPPDPAIWGWVDGIANSSFGTPPSVWMDDGWVDVLDTPAWSWNIEEEEDVKTEDEGVVKNPVSIGFIKDEEVVRFSWLVVVGPTCTKKIETHCPLSEHVHR